MSKVWLAKVPRLIKEAHRMSYVLSNIFWVATIDPSTIAATTELQSEYQVNWHKNQTPCSKLANALLHVLTKLNYF